ncbi:addiction module protein [Muricauda oceani]|jgi:putative addiction module component (TIGR02574 family)|uniref:Addiction module protein n=2 Tax=Flagellimonas TaxID=444459 RepID=A0A6G7IYG4_9FLAO|nr:MULTISPECIES: addiction module protein [Allomuricauda]MBW8245189.1 addiction module protein [Allomuricauda oceani]MDF0708803.1 addiction module protein [[Muricauda] okinawensis]QII43595.1 addiction module protein [Allomuricauda oceani]
MDIQDIKKMPVAKRILIAQDIWDSIEDKDSIELSDEMKTELDSRIDHHKSGGAKYYSLEESRKRNAKLRNDL